MTYFNEFGQARLGWNVGVPSGGITPSTLWNSIYSVYNADSVGSSSLKTSLFAVYNGESNANDSFGSNNGTAQGGLTYTTGKIGNAFNLNGTNSYVTLPSNTLTPSGDFSISLWFNTNSESTERHILSNVHKQGGAAGQWKGWDIFTYASKVYFRLWNTNVNSEVISTTAIVNSTWYNVTVTKSGTTQRIYINGTLEATNNSAVTPNYTSPNYPVIGAQFYHTSAGYDTSTLFNGRIDAISSWNKALTQSEITELYNSGNGAQYITNDFYKPTTNDALNTNNGTAQGGLTYGVGKIGTAFQFNGSNAYVSLPNNSLNLTGDFSYSAWVYFRDIPTGDRFIVTATNGNGINVNLGVSFGILAGQLILGVYANTNSSTFNSNGILLPSTWYHVAVTKKLSNAPKFYINGTLQTTSLLAGTNTLNPIYTSGAYPNSLATIGTYRYNNGSSAYGYSNANIDAVNVWQKELTQSEITELYNAGNGKQYPN